MIRSRLLPSLLSLAILSVLAGEIAIAAGSPHLAAALISLR